jgi:hypothetical protein
MARLAKRRGPSWQCPEWRRHLHAAPDLNARARQAFVRLEAAARSQVAQQSSYSLARMAVPFLGDGVPAGGAFSIRPEFSSFA